MAKDVLEWDDDTAVTVWRDGAVVGSGRGHDRATALQDAWITLIDSREMDLAAWVASEYRKLTGQDPVR
jgi:hypothetical protein